MSIWIQSFQNPAYPSLTRIRAFAPRWWTWVELSFSPVASPSPSIPTFLSQIKTTFLSGKSHLHVQVVSAKTSCTSFNRLPYYVFLYLSVDIYESQVSPHDKILRPFIIKQIFWRSNFCGKVPSRVCSLNILVLIYIWTRFNWWKSMFGFGRQLSQTPILSPSISLGKTSWTSEWLKQKILNWSELLIFGWRCNCSCQLKKATLTPFSLLLKQKINPQTAIILMSSFISQPCLVQGREIESLNSHHIYSLLSSLEVCLIVDYYIVEYFPFYDTRVFAAFKRWTLVHVGPK